MRSKTWAGFSSCLNLRRNFTPWLSPLFELTKTNNGLVQDGGHVAFQKPGCEEGKGQEADLGATEDTRALSITCQADPAGCRTRTYTPRKPARE